jgi:flagellar biosynthesis/type III secretory pathway chaperone
MTQTDHNYRAMVGQLAKLIAEGLAEAGCLYRILSEEHRAVTQSGAELTTLLADKKAAIDRLNSLDVALRDALARAGAPRDQAQIAGWIGSWDTDGRILPSWREFAQLLWHCRRQNRTNGAALGVQRLAVERALRQLRGTAPAALYNHTGLEQSFDSSHTLGRV